MKIPEGEITKPRKDIVEVWNSHFFSVQDNPYT